MVEFNSGTAQVVAPINRDQELSASLYQPKESQYVNPAWVNSLREAYSRGDAITPIVNQGTNDTYPIASATPEALQEVARIIQNDEMAALGMTNEEIARARAAQATNGAEASKIPTLEAMKSSLELKQQNADPNDAIGQQMRRNMIYFLNQLDAANSYWKSNPPQR